MPLDSHCWDPVLLWFLETPYHLRQGEGEWLNGKWLGLKKILVFSTDLHLSIQLLFKTIPDQSIAKNTPHLRVLSPMSKGSLGTYQRMPLNA